VGQEPRVRKGLEEIGVEVPRLEGGQPQSLDIGFGEDPFDQMLQTVSIAEVVAVRPEVDTAQHDLPVTESLELMDLAQHRAVRYASARTAGNGDDAIGAVIVAAVLDLEEGARPGRVARLEKHLRVGVGARWVEQSPRFGKLEQTFLVGVANHQIHADLPDFTRGDLGITTRDDDLGLRVATTKMTDELARLLGSDGGHGAGVEDAQIGRFSRAHDPMAGGCQTTRHGIDLADVQPAPNGLETNPHRFLIRFMPVARNAIQFSRSFLILSVILILSSAM